MHTPPKPVYVTRKPMTAHQVLEKAAEILESQYARTGQFNNPEIVKQYLSCQLSKHEAEVFAVMFLDTQHQLIQYKEMFFGTIDASSVYPREVVKAALQLNASALILAHNHPSGITDPSQADKLITRKLVDTLALIDVRVIDHVIVGKEPLSFAEQGLL